MTCYQHPEIQATAYCRSCGRALCGECQRISAATVFCPEHAPPGAPESALPPPVPPRAPAPVNPGANPGLAFALGLIPGVGAIYNGQYAKGLIHALIFGLMVSIIDTVHGGLEGLLGILLAAFVFYMAFEAYHTARRRRQGEPLDGMSSLFDMRGGASSGSAVALILVGVIFLLNTLEVVSMRQILKFWPVLLIALGANMLYSRLTSASSEEGGGAERQEAHHEQ